jgi:hypothetical protein
MPTDCLVVIIAGSDDPWHAQLEAELQSRTSVLTPPDSIVITDRLETIEAMPAEVTAVAVMFADGKPTEDQIILAAECLARGMSVFPVVEDLSKFTELVPFSWHPYNGFELRFDSDLPELAGLVLEALGLQRGRRKIFISYARADAVAMAHQLRDAFTGRWYSVFLDTISIRPGRNFQAELLQELIDSDVFLLLNSPSVLRRPYVQKEIAFTLQAGLGGVQLVWPGQAPRPDAIFTSLDLSIGNRLASDGTLTNAGLKELLHAVASERTAVQRQREQEVARAVETYAQRCNYTVVSHLGRYLELVGPGGQVRLDVALGLPTSIELALAWTSAGSQVPKYVVYDPLGITNHMADHLDFLGKRFPLELLDWRDSLNWRILP